MSIEQKWRETEELRNFVADRDITDSIRMESAALSPRGDAHIKSEVRAISSTLVADYGDFMPPNRRELLSGIDDRVIVMSEAAVDTFSAVWRLRDEPETTGKEIRIGVKGATPRVGFLSVVSNPLDVWDTLPDEIKNLLLKMSDGDQTGAEAFFSMTSFCSTLSEEVIHQFQDFTLPRAFTECGVKYYKYQGMEKLGWPFMKGQPDELRVGFYSRLINIHGDDVHKAFFGSPDISYYDRSQVVDRFTPEVVSLLFRSPELGE